MGRLALPSHFPHWEMSLTNFLPEISEAPATLNAPTGTVNSTLQNDSRPTHQIRHSKITGSKISCNNLVLAWQGHENRCENSSTQACPFHPTDRRKPSCTPLVFVPPSLSRLRLTCSSHPRGPKHSELSNSLNYQTLNLTRNLEVTGNDDNAFAFDAEAPTDEHMRLAVQGDHEYTHDVPELDFQDGA